RVVVVGDAREGGVRRIAGAGQDLEALAGNVRAGRLVPVAPAREVVARQIHPALVHIVLFDVGQDERLPAAPAAAVGADGGRQLFKVTVVVVHGQPELLEVVGAAHAVGGLAHLLHGR